MNLDSLKTTDATISIERALTDINSHPIQRRSHFHRVFSWLMPSSAPDRVLERELKNGNQQMIAWDLKETVVNWLACRVQRKSYGRRGAFPWKFANGKPLRTNFVKSSASLLRFSENSQCENLPMKNFPNGFSFALFVWRKFVRPNFPINL